MNPYSSSLYIAKKFARNLVTAENIFQKSCYRNVDFKIKQNSNITNAVMQLSSLYIGCLAVVNEENNLIGVFSEGDFINKVASQRKNTDTTQVKDVCTMAPNIIVAKKTDSLDSVMSKMMFKNLRHILLVDDTDTKFIGMISIRDVVKEINKKNKDTITRLSDFHIGKGGFFGSE